jgi:hypothetical protein
MPISRTGLDGQTYLVFAPSEDAHAQAALLDLPLHCFDGFENALALDAYVAATQRVLTTLPAIAAALKMNAALVERAGQRCETPPSWSFFERDLARQAAWDALDNLQALDQAARPHLTDWAAHNPQAATLDPRTC